MRLLNPTPSWEQAYLAAILETDDSSLPLRLTEARASIDEHLYEMLTPDGLSPGELQAINRALEGLDIICREGCSGDAARRN